MVDSGGGESRPSHREIQGEPGYGHYDHYRRHDHEKATLRLFGGARGIARKNGSHEMALQHKKAAMQLPKPAAPLAGSARLGKLVR